MVNLQYQKKRAVQLGHLNPLVKKSMQNTGRLNLAELKAKADQSNLVENLEAIQGGNLFNCHGNWGAIGKRIGAAAERIVENVINDQLDKL